MEEIIKTEEGVQVTTQIVETFTIEEIEATITQQTDIIANYNAQKAQLDEKIAGEQAGLDRFTALKEAYENNVL
jgi:hypothetical protein